MPDDWEPLAPFGFAGPGDEEDRMTAQAMERWLREPTPAADHAKQQLQLLPAMYDEFSLVQNGGSFLLFRFRNEEGDRALGKVIYLTLGPLVCDLTLLALDGPDKERDRLFEAIGKTFELRNVEFLAKVEKRPLLTPGVALTGERRKYPRACISLPTPSGWDATYEDGSAMFRRSGAEIRLQRVLGSDGDVGAWFKQRMQDLQDTKSLLLASEKGALERGDYAAVLYEEKGAGRTWNTAAVKRSLDVFVSDEQPLLWTLTANVAGFDGHRPVLESLVASTELLPPEEWETKIAEPWIDLTLKGPWKPQGPGLYVMMVPAFMCIYLTTQPEKTPFETAVPSIIESVRKSAGIREVYSEKQAIGSWQGKDALRYGVEGFADLPHVQGTRSVWVSSGKTLYGGIVWGPDSFRVEKLHLRLVEALRIP